MEYHPNGCSRSSGDEKNGFQNGQRPTEDCPRPPGHPLCSATHYSPLPYRTNMPRIADFLFAQAKLARQAALPTLRGKGDRDHPASVCHPIRGFLSLPRSYSPPEPEPGLTSQWQAPRTQKQGLGSGQSGCLRSHEGHESVHEVPCTSPHQSNGVVVLISMNAGSKKISLDSGRRVISWFIGVGVAGVSSEWMLALFSAARLSASSCCKPTLLRASGARISSEMAGTAAIARTRVRTVANFRFMICLSKNCKAYSKQAQTQD